MILMAAEAVTTESAAKIVQQLGFPIAITLFLLAGLFWVIKEALKRFDARDAASKEALNRLSDEYSKKSESMMDIIDKGRAQNADQAVEHAKQIAAMFNQLADIAKKNEDINERAINVISENTAMFKDINSSLTNFTAMHQEALSTVQILVDKLGSK